MTEVLGRVAGDENQNIASSQWAAARMLSHRIQRTGREIGERGFDPPPEKGPALADRLGCGAVSLDLSLALTPGGSPHRVARTFSSVFATVCVAKMNRSTDPAMYRQNVAVS
jgi:hypothetical protein